ncbi:MAG: hypothetical protein VX677_15330 [Candidatus Poribacteria bacterium]|nr:hypothetical protein [Candidatus Poribacteria bacterium]
MSIDVDPEQLTSAHQIFVGVGARGGEYMHRESVELRRDLDECRLTDDTPKPIAQI